MFSTNKSSEFGAEKIDTFPRSISVIKIMLAKFRDFLPGEHQSCWRIEVGFDVQIVLHRLGSNPHLTRRMKRAGHQRQKGPIRRKVDSGTGRPIVVVAKVLRPNRKSPPNQARGGGVYVGAQTFVRAMSNFVSRRAAIRCSSTYVPVPSAGRGRKTRSGSRRYLCWLEERPIPTCRFLL